MNELIGRASNTGMVAVEESASIAEVQAKMILARNFPRDVERSLSYIKFECQNKDLAEKATYEFKRGTSVVKGPSIRLVECVARYWGNLLSGVKEVSSEGKKATVKAYCWDLETNYADEKFFDVAYVRDSKANGKVQLTDERDKYEVMANMAARRKRACMQAIIPKFVIDTAVAACEETLEKSMAAEGVEETRKKMLEAFKAKASWITEADFEAVCQKPFDSISIKDIVKLRNLYNAINDGFVKVEVAFGKEDHKAVNDEKAEEILSSVNEIVNGADGNGADS